MVQQWNVGMIEAQIADAAGASLFDNVKWWPVQKDLSSIADPFPVVVDGQLHVLAETFNHIDQFGTISSFAVKPTGDVAESREAVRFPFHLSYPCVVKHEGLIYATFEAIETKEITIYRCDRFPHFWSRVKTIVAGKAFSDPTLFQHENRWWVLATRHDQFSEGNSLLHAWYSDDGIDGQWHPHLLNPIKCDVRSSRAAGSLFEKDGALFRPSQNCSRSYGQSIILNKIARLTPTEFSEEQVTEFLPGSRFPNGVHHLGRSGHWVTVDGRRDVLSLRLGFKKIWQRMNVKKSLRQSSPAADAAPDLVGATLVDKKTRTPLYAVEGPREEI